MTNIIYYLLLLYQECQEFSHKQGIYPCEGCLCSNLISIAEKVNLMECVYCLLMGLLIEEQESSTSSCENEMFEI